MNLLKTIRISVRSGNYNYIFIPPHSVSNNRTTTCGSRVSTLVGSGKRPPVQVTIGPPYVAVE